MASLRYCTVHPRCISTNMCFCTGAFFPSQLQNVSTLRNGSKNNRQSLATFILRIESMQHKQKNKRCAKTQNANCYVARTENSEACRTLPRLPEQTKVEIYDTAVNETSFQNYYLDFILFGADTIQNLGGACTSRPKKISSACCDHICASRPHKLEPIEVWSGGAALMHQAVTPWPASEHFKPQGTIDIELCLGTASKAIQTFQDLDRNARKNVKEYA